MKNAPEPSLEQQRFLYFTVRNATLFGDLWSFPSCMEGMFLVPRVRDIVGLKFSVIDERMTTRSREYFGCRILFSAPEEGNLYVIADVVKY